MSPVRLFSILLPLLVSAAATLGCGASGEATTSTDDEVRARSNPRVACVLEYATSGPPGEFGFVAAQSGLLSSSTSATGAGYTFSVIGSQNAGLAIAASLSGPEGALSYAVLPRAVLGAAGDYLFEIGAQIKPVRRRGYDGMDHDFDSVRGYCSLDRSRGDAGTPRPDAQAPVLDGGGHTDALAPLDRKGGAEPVVVIDAGADGA